MNAPLFSATPGNTPISEDELGALIPNLATREELNEWEVRAARAINQQPGFELKSGSSS
jgi:hypothetical protein